VENVLHFTSSDQVAEYIKLFRFVSHNGRYFSHTHTHHDRFTALFPWLPGWASDRRNLFLDLVVQGKITEADTPTIRLGASPSGLMSDPPASSPILYTGCPSCCNLPSLSWLGTGTKYAGLLTQWPGYTPSALVVT